MNITKQEDGLLVKLDAEDIDAIRRIYPTLSKINMIYNSDMYTYEGVILPMFEDILKEAGVK